MKRIVKFRNGKFGLRSGYWLFGYRFQDFKSIQFKWGIRSRHIKDCQLNTINDVKSFKDNPDYIIID